MIERVNLNHRHGTKEEITSTRKSDMEILNYIFMLGRPLQTAAASLGPSLEIAALNLHARSGTNPCWL